MTSGGRMALELHFKDTPVCVGRDNDKALVGIFLILLPAPSSKCQEGLGHSCYE